MVFWSVEICYSYDVPQNPPRVPAVSTERPTAGERDQQAAARAALHPAPKP